jgi:hypothetical protein
MGGLQGSFPRFKKRLPVGLNQIRSVLILNMRGPSHCMVMTGSGDTTLMRMVCMMSKTIK